MTAGPGQKYRPGDPAAFATHPYTAADRLPADDLVFFRRDVIPQRDRSRCYAASEVEKRGAPPYDPGLMATLRFYAYAVGVCSRRTIARAWERHRAFLALVGPQRPDFRTLSDFRTEHLGVLPDFCNPVRTLAHETGLVPLGLGATDGRKFPGNASRHKAMSYGSLNKEAERLQAEIAALLKQAQPTDAAEGAARGARRGDELPEELRVREERLAQILPAKARWAAQAKAAAEAERQRRAEAAAEWERAGQKRPGKGPPPPSEVPDDKAPTSFTDPDLKVMPPSNKRCEYSGNAPVVVDDAGRIIVACAVVTETNDKPQAGPMAPKALANLEAAGIQRPVDEPGEVPQIAAALDTGYVSAAAVADREAWGIDPSIAVARQKHHGPLPAAAATPVSAAASPQGKRRAQLRTALGRAVYGLRTGVVEPVFGRSKGVRGFRRFAWRGLGKSKGEWCLVCRTHNRLKIWRYRSAPGVS